MLNLIDLQCFAIELFLCIVTEHLCSHHPERVTYICIVVISGKGITCDLLSVIPTPKYMMIPYRGLVFLYVKIPDRKLLTLHFLHTENRRKVDNGIRVQGPINGRVGPFFVNTYYMPIELTSLRCLTIDNIECKVEFLEREAFSLLHYVPKPKDPIYW